MDFPSFLFTSFYPRTTFFSSKECKQTLSICGRLVRHSQLHFIFLVPLERLHLSALLAVGLGHESSISFCFVKEKWKDTCFSRRGCLSMSLALPLVNLVEMFTLFLKINFLYTFYHLTWRWNRVPSYSRSYFQNIAVFLVKHLSFDLCCIRLYQMLPRSVLAFKHPKSSPFCSWKVSTPGSLSVSLKLLSSSLVILISTSMILPRH